MPPLIEAPRRLLGPLAFFGLVMAAIGVALLTEYLGFRFPKCSLLKVTGVPCAFCGGTRSLQAIGHWDWAQAFWWNPLVMLAAIGSAAGAIFSVVAPRRFETLLARAKRWPLMWVGLGIVAVNWIFVAMFLPR